MNDKTDQELLRDYVESGSEDAFAVLVRRYVDLVYSAALRMVGDQHLSQDVTQAVFTAVSQNAKKLLHCTVLSGWLYRTTRNQAVMSIRSEVRRASREREAACMNQDPNTSAAELDQVSLHLDFLMSQLARADRDALLLRFFEGKTARQIGEQLGLSEEAAQKRVSRALDRLRQAFSKAGLAVSSATLGGIISFQAVQAAPTGLAATVTAGVLYSTAANTGAISLFKFMTLTKLKTGILGATLLAAVSIPVIQQHSLATLRSDLAVLEMQKQQPAEWDRLEAENRRLAALEVDPVELERLRREHSEALQFRAEIVGTHQVINEFSRARTDEKWKRSAFSTPILHVATEVGEPFAANGFFPAEGWANVGAATPESSLQTALASMRSGNAQELLSVLEISPEVSSKLASQLITVGAKEFPWNSAKGAKVESKAGLDRDGNVEYVCEFNLESARPLARTHFYLIRVGDEWKLTNIVVEQPDWELVKR